MKIYVSYCRSIFKVKMEQQQKVKTIQTHKTRLLVHKTQFILKLTSESSAHCILPSVFVSLRPSHKCIFCSEKWINISSIHCSYYPLNSLSDSGSEKVSIKYRHLKTVGVRTKSASFCSWSHFSKKELIIFPIALFFIHLRQKKTEKAWMCL